MILGLALTDTRYKVTYSNRYFHLKVLGKPNIYKYGAHQMGKFIKNGTLTFPEGILVNGIRKYVIKENHHLYLDRVIAYPSYIVELMIRNLSHNSILLI